VEQSKTTNERRHRADCGARAHGHERTWLGLGIGGAERTLLQLGLGNGRIATSGLYTCT
jgi:hypothetical protein